MARPILIIEDDPDIAEVLRYCLEAHKFETRVALTGNEGLSASLDKGPATTAYSARSSLAGNEWPGNLPQPEGLQRK
jgi:DNA-binding NtrC family response regulator